MSEVRRLQESLDHAEYMLERSKKMLQEAVRNRRHLESILETLPSGLIVVEGPDAIITIINRRALEIFGWSAEVGVQKPGRSAELNLLSPDGSPFPPDEQPLNRAAMYGEVLLGEEVLIRHADGTVIAAVANAAPLYDGSEITGAVGTFEEITAIKAMQKALERAYSRERRLSVMLQKALLPSIPERMNGLLMASEYRAAYKGDYMGGDFYDIFSPRPGLTGIVIGDASGKGIQGAIRTARTKYTLRAYAYENPYPSSVVERANNTLYAQSGSECFVTVFYGLHNAENGILSFANAGHELPLCLRYSDKKVLELEAAGMVLGIRRDNKYVENGIQLQNGDRLLFYTDGTTDARRGTAFYGINRLKRFLAARASESPAEFTGHLVQRLLEFSEGHLQDDIAILMVCAGKYVPRLNTAQ